MPLHILQCDPGGEYLIPWAKRKLDYWHGEMRYTGHSAIFKIVQVSDGSVLYANSFRIAPETFIDKIRITAGGPWDFHVNGGPLTNGRILGDAGSLSKKNVFLGKVGSPALRRVLLNTETDSSVAFSSTKTGTSSFGTFSTGVILKYVSATGQVVEALYPNLVQAGAVWTLSDGTDSLDVTAQIKTTNTIFDIGSDTLLVAYDFFTGANYGSALFAVSLASGVVLTLSYTVPVIDYTRSVLEQFPAPIGNLTDVFLAERIGIDGSTGANPYSLAALAIYRNGVLGFAPTTQLRVRANDTISPAFAVSKGGWAAFYDYMATINVILSPVPPAGPAYLLLVTGTRATDGSYTYAESAVLLDALYDFEIMASSTTKFMTGVSLVAEYLFVRFPRVGGGGPGTGTEVAKIIANDGSVIEVPEVEVPYFTNLNFIAALSFPAQACVVGSRLDGSGWTRVAFFLFSDGTYTAVTLPAAARHASIINFAAGSNTLGYVYISDGALLKYIAISDGSLIELPLPPAKPATDTLPEYAVSSLRVAGFVDQKVGCRLMFSATYADGSLTYHHWDETGAIFNYGAPSATANLLVVPTASALHRMKLLDLWNPA